MGKKERLQRATARAAKWDAVSASLGPIKDKVRNGLPLAPDEQRLWGLALSAPRKVRAAMTIKVAERREPTMTSRKKGRAEYDPYSGASGRRTGSRPTQGPAGGIRSVVSGGAPGLGKRR